MSGSKISVFKEKLDQVIKKNEVLEVLNKINQVLQGEEELGDRAPGDKPRCPIVFVDIKRSFSQYKNILTDRRHSFTQKNLVFFY